MEPQSKALSLHEINNINLVDFLSSLGHQPLSKKGNEYRYLSPFKKEVFPTFVVFADSNTWRNSNSLSRKTTMDFGIEYFDCSIADLKNKFAGYLAQQGQSIQDRSKRADLPIEIFATGQLSSSVVALYLKTLRIPWDIAKEHCHQIEFGYNGRLHQGIAFQNDSGGLDIRNAFFHGYSGAEDKTFHNAGSQIVSVFGNFIDFLSYKSIQRPEPQQLTNWLILNSSLLKDNAHVVMNAHLNVQLFLPNTPGGRIITDSLTRSSSKYEDLSGLYKHYGSLNDWICYIGRATGHAPQEGQHRLRRSG